MFRTVVFTCCMVSLLSACKLTEKDYEGIYALDQFPKTVMKIHHDRTFEFSKVNPNPYLHPFDHPGEYYFETSGTWKPAGKRTISLTSRSDTGTYPLVFLQPHPSRISGSSNFTFYDEAGDTVKILYVQFADSSIVMSPHRSMETVTVDLHEHGTLEFHFYGYRPYLFVNGGRPMMDYDVILRPEFQPGFFRQTLFSMRRKQMIDIKRKGVFWKEENE